MEKVIAVLRQIAIQVTIANLVKEKPFLSYSEAYKMAENIISGGVG